MKRAIEAIAAGLIGAALMTVLIYGPHGLGT